MRIVVTGHLGYLGTVLTPMLRAAGHAVRGIDAAIFRACAFRPVPTDSETVRVDIRDIEPGHLADADAVVHLAALSNDPLGDLEPAVTHALNHHAALRVAECAKASGVRRVIAAATCSGYGSAGHDWVDEATPPNPVTPYAASKAAMERDLLAMRSPTFDIALPRFATAFGISPMLRFDLVVNNLTAWAAATGVVRLKSDGSAHRPFVHTRDIARSIIAMLDAPAISTPIVNIGAPDCTTTIAELADAIAGALGSAGHAARVEQAEGSGTDPRSYRVRFDAMRTALPALHIRERIGPAAIEIARALAKSPADTSAFEGPQFSRVAHLRALLADGKLDSDLRYRA